MAFFEFTHMGGIIRVDKTGGLNHVDVVSEMALKEGVVDVKLSEGPSSTDGNTKDETNSGRFDHWTECVVIVNTQALMKAFGNKAGFVAVNGAIKMAFDAKDPFTADGSVEGVEGDEIPSVVVNKGIKFFLEGVTPLRLLESLRNRGWFGRYNGGEIEFNARFVNVFFCSGEHMVSVGGGKGRGRGWRERIEGWRLVGSRGRGGEVREGEGRRVEANRKPGKGAGLGKEGEEEGRMKWVVAKQEEANGKACRR